jgi:nicotinamide phosphoribosyltransferase
MNQAINNKLFRHSKIDMGQILAPKPTDKAYMQTDQLTISLICRADSYKFSHAFAFPDNVVGMSAYGTARVKSHVTLIPFGMQLLVKRFLTQRVTMAHIDAAEEFAEAHFGRKLFARADWEKVVTDYDGALPLIIRAVPEGTPIKGGMPMWTVTCLDEDLFWISVYFETIIQRGVWYPTTVASLDYDIKQEIKRFYEISGADMGLLPFALHDFGGRGVTCSEQAEIGGAAHLVSFMGSDTIEGVLTANFYYKEAMAGFSVFATEHSVECSFGLDAKGEHNYLEHVLNQAVPGSIISIVIDGKDVLRCAATLCAPEAEGGFREKIIASGAKIVFRPDSGDMLEIVPKILRMQEAAFGSVINSKGYRKINYVGIIQGATVLTT